MDTHHWYRRVLPVTALAVGVVALLALVFPGVGQQVALSTTHVPQEYVALSFTRGSGGTVDPCARSGKDVLVSFTIDSELSEARNLDYVVTVGDARRTSTIVIEPGETTRMTETVRHPSRDKYAVSVRLPGADREISARCPGVKR